MTVERYSPLQSAVCSAIVPAGVEAFSGGPSAVYEAIAGGRVSVMPRASLRLVLNLRHLMPFARRQKRALGLSTQETVT